MFEESVDRGNRKGRRRTASKERVEGRRPEENDKTYVVRKGCVQETYTTKEVGVLKRG